MLALVLDATDRESTASALPVVRAAVYMEGSLRRALPVLRGPSQLIMHMFVLMCPMSYTVASILMGRGFLQCTCLRGGYPHTTDRGPTVPSLPVDRAIVKREVFASLASHTRAL